MSVSVQTQEETVEVVCLVAGGSEEIAAVEMEFARRGCYIPVKEPGVYVSGTLSLAKATELKALLANSDNIILV